MPLLDFTRVLTNPILDDYFTVNRRVENVNSSGISVVTTTPIPQVCGVVYPSNENDLKRLPDADVMAKCISVITTFALYGEAESQGTSYKPDVVVWNGDQFLVRVVEDYSNYGAGFIQAICTSMDLVDQPPVG